MMSKRNTILLSFVAFLAFGFQTVGVFTDPLSKGKLSIASTSTYNYGVFGYCKLEDGSRECSGYSVGYDIDDTDLDYGINSSGKKILTEILISHVVAAGLQLISLLLAISTIWKNQGWYIFIICYFIFTFLVSSLSFIVEMLLFRLHLQFSGWFTLAASVLSIVYTILMGLDYSSLRKDRDSPEDEDLLLDSNDKSFFPLDEKPFDLYTTSLGEIKGPYNMSNSSLSSTSLPKKDQMVTVTSLASGENESIHSSVYDSASDVFGPKQNTMDSRRNAGNPLVPAGAYVSGAGVENARIRQAPNNQVRMPNAGRPAQHVPPPQVATQAVTSHTSNATQQLSNVAPAAASVVPGAVNNFQQSGSRQQHQGSNNVQGVQTQQTSPSRNQQVNQSPPRQDARNTNPGMAQTWNQTNQTNQNYQPKYTPPRQQYQPQYAQQAPPPPQAWYQPQYSQPVYQQPMMQQQPRQYAQPMYQQSYGPPNQPPPRLPLSDFALQNNPDFMVPGNRRRQRPM